MNSRDAIMKALTPNDMFNQKGLVWRSIRTLAQFASVEQEEVLGILDEHFQGLVSVRPNGKHPENGPLVALDEHVPDEPADPAPPEPQVAIVAAIEGVAAAANGVLPDVHGEEVDVSVNDPAHGDEAEPHEAFEEFVGLVEEQDHE